jgi:hypothetical protein
MEPRKRKNHDEYLATKKADNKNKIISQKYQIKSESVTQFMAAKIKS